MRDHSTDIAKALGIVLVIIGHSPLVLDAKGEPFRIVFSFHMPLFYFMAGFFRAPSSRCAWRCARAPIRCSSRISVPSR